MEELKSKLALAKQEKEMAELEKGRLADLLRKEKERTLNAYRDKLQKEDELQKKVTALEKEAKLQNARLNALTIELELTAERSQITGSKLRSIADSLEGMDCLGSGVSNVPRGDWEVTDIKTEPEDTPSETSVAAVTPSPPPSTSQPNFIRSEVAPKGRPQGSSSSPTDTTEDLANEREGQVPASVSLPTSNSPRARSSSIESYEGFSTGLARIRDLFDPDDAGLSTDPRDRVSQTSDSSDFACAALSLNSYYGLFTPAPPVMTPSAGEGYPVEDWLQSLSNPVIIPAPVAETPEHRRESVQRSQRAPVSTPAPAPLARQLFALSDLARPPPQHRAVESNDQNCVCGRTFKNSKGLAIHIAYFERQKEVPGSPTRSKSSKLAVSCDHCDDSFANKGLLTVHMKRKHGNDFNSGPEDPDPVPAKRQTKTRKRGGA